MAEKMAGLYSGVLMYSDEWVKEGYQKKDGGHLSGPVSYSRAYSNSTGEFLGVIVDNNLADDFHYELLREDWEAFCERCLTDGNELEAFRTFIEEKGTDTVEGLFAFEDALDEAEIEYKKMAFYDFDFD